MFTFTPLLGSRSESDASQSILEFDGGVKILVDVGWDESFDAGKLTELERQVPTISIILLTHATISHLGAYAHCCKHIPLFGRIPVYATTPVISLGRVLLQDLYASAPLAASFLPASALADSGYSFSAFKDGEDPHILLPAPSNEEIAHFFSLIHPLKYSQPHEPLPSPFSPPLDGLAITAYGAGHTLGGTIWHVQHGSESVVYAVEWNQARENVLAGAAWLSGSGTGAEVMEQLRQPSALICSSRGGNTVAVSGGRVRRDEMVQTLIRQALAGGGSVLIPCDTSARVLELSYMLEHCWEAVGTVETATSMERAKLYLATSSSGATMRLTRSLLEWMDEAVVQEFEASTSKPTGHPHSGSQQATPLPPFEFKHLKLLERNSQIQRALGAEGPKVFLASDASLEWGYARELIRHFSQDPRNLILLTGRVVPREADNKNDESSLIHTLWDIVERGRKESTSTGEDQNAEAAIFEASNREVQIRSVQTSPLAGDDLPLYQQYLARQRQRQSALHTDKSSTLEASADAVDDRSSSTSSSSEESDTEHQGKALNVSTTLAHPKSKLGLTDEELGVNVLLRRKNVHDYDVRGKRGREKMFPYVAKRRRVDDFGDLIRPEEYLRAEERDDVDGKDLRTDQIQKDSNLGQKRRWDATDALPVDRRRSVTNGNEKRRKKNNERPGAARDGGNATTNGVIEAEDESEESDYEPAEPIMTGPKKATFSSDSVQLKMKVAAVDFTGLHDQRSLQMLIPLIKPRKLILTAGGEDEILALAADCRKLLDAGDSGAKTGSAEVFTPLNGATVDASVDTNAWTIKLSQRLFKHLRWQKFRGLGIVTVNGRIEAQENTEELEGQGSGKRLKIQEGNDGDTPSRENNANVVPILSELPAGASGSGRSSAQGIHVGDLRLAELRKIMQASGHIAEFKGEGTLLVDGLIAVRKSGIGKIEVECGGNVFPGSSARQPDASFFNVKRKIYEGLAVVAAR